MEQQRLAKARADYEAQQEKEKQQALPARTVDSDEVSILDLVMENE